MHYSDDELATFRNDRQAVQHAAIETHLRECSECRETLALFDEVDEGLCDPEVWSHVPAFLTRPSRLDEALAMKAAIERQNAAAVQRLAPRLKTPLHFEDANVADDPRFCDAGVVRMLTKEAAELREKSPKFALQLATAACVIATKLESEPIDSQRLLLAVALREKANALRFHGRFTDALRALEEAKTLFSALPNPSFDIAIVEYVRASVVIQLGHNGEALKLARTASRVFREFRDQERQLKAQMIEAIALDCLARRAEALEVYERLILLASELGQQNIAAYGFQNAAISYAELGEIDKAERYNAEALARYDELGVDVEKARTEWELARLLVLRGNLDQGAKALDLVRRELLDLGLRDDHGLATLDWAGVRLALDRPDGVADACREIIVHFDSEGATRNARLALAHLQEALRTGEATSRLVLGVRDYLKQLPRDPAAVFQPVK